MLDIDYSTCFSCPKCKETPEFLILDGITMGTLKELPDYTQEFDEGQRYALVPMSVRVFIPDLATRKRIKEYSKKGA